MSKNERIEKIVSCIPERFFFEKSFEGNNRNPILADVYLCYDKVNHSNILNCSPLLKKEQEYHLFRKYNYLKYRLKKLTTGFEPPKDDNSPKQSPPIKLERLGEKSLLEIEDTIHKLQEIRNILLKSNMRLIVKQISRFADKDGLQRDEFFSNAYMHMLKSIDYFDYRLNFKFSTYYINVLKRNLYKDYTNCKKLEDRFTEIEEPETLQQQKEDFAVVELNNRNNREVVEKIFEIVKSKMKNADAKIDVLKCYFGIDHEEGMTLQDVGKIFNVSKERIRQIKKDVLDCAVKYAAIYSPVL
jgi:RNA polymerase sigma factor (sigma-70 family)